MATVATMSITKHIAVAAMTKLNTMYAQTSASSAVAKQEEANA